MAGFALLLDFNGCSFPACFMVKWSTICSRSQMGDSLMVDALLVADEGWVMVLVTDCRLMVVGS